MTNKIASSLTLLAMTSSFQSAKELLQTAHKILIISHRGPDGDTVGANLALRLALKQQWNKEIISACVDSLPANCDFLPESGAFALDFDLSWPDAIVAVDCGSHYMMKFHEKKPALLSGSPPIINIDHHATNDRFGKINIIDENAASATQILYGFFGFCGLKITRQIATCLLNGLYFDTGSFKHSNTTPEVLETASALLWKGADFKTISRKQFHTMPVRQLRLYGKILERMRVNSKRLTVAAVTSRDLEETGANPEDTTGAIDFLNSVPDGDFCCLLHEDKKGLMKGSFRCRADGFDVAKVAGVFGGGGHKKAAGFSLAGRVLEIDPKIKIGK